MGLRWYGLLLSVQTEPEEDLITLDNVQSIVSFESYREQYERYEQGDCIVFL